MRSPRSNRPATRLTAFVLAALGMVLVVLSLVADTLDLGGGRGFGYQQLIALIVGLGLLLAAGALLMQGRGGPRAGSPGNGFELER